MTRKFCDLCEKPVSDTPLTICLSEGDSWHGTKVSGSSFVEGTYQPRLIISASVTAENHRTIRDGAQLDLCDDCRHDLLMKLAEKFGPAKPHEHSN